MLNFNKSGFVLLLVITLLAYNGTESSAKEKSSRPNIILILADDLGYETLGCNGGTSYKTPNLDKLAVTGVRFTNCYANPLCTPTRVTLMTGRYMYRNYTAFAQLPSREPTFGHMMQDAGYVTTVVGKWQLQNRSPYSAGFDEFLLKIDSNRDGYADPVVYSSENPEPKKLVGEYGPDVFLDYIFDFLERHQNKEFFMYYPMHLTHFYFTPTPESPEWENGDRHLSAQHHLRPDPLNQRFFTDMVSYMDKNIGRIVKKLDDLGIRENTMILFLGDNGSEVSILSNMGDEEIKGEKGTLSKAGTHVPMVVNWPRNIQSGHVSKSLVVPADFMATIAEITKSKPRRPTGDGVLDGISFLPALSGNTDKKREWALVEYVLENRGGMYMGKEGRYVFNGRWKLYGTGISRRGQNYYKAGHLYDLLNDPLEVSPIAQENDTRESERARKEAQSFLNKHPVPKSLIWKEADSQNQ